MPFATINELEASFLRRSLGSLALATDTLQDLRQKFYTSELVNPVTWKRAAFDNVVRTVTGVIVLTPVGGTLYTLPANRLVGAGKSLRVHVQGIITTTAGSSFTVNFGGMAWTITTPAALAGQAFEIDVELVEVSGTYRAFGKMAGSMSNARYAQTSVGFVETVDNAISLAITPAAAGDTVSIYRTDVFLMG